MTFDPAREIQYPSVKTWVRVIVWPMQSDSSEAYLCEKFLWGQGRAEISKIMKIMVWDTYKTPFGRKIDVGSVLRATFLSHMACRDGQHSIQAIFF